MAEKPSRTSVWIEGREDLLPGSNPGEPIPQGGEPSDSLEGGSPSSMGGQIPEDKPEETPKGSPEDKPKPLKERKSKKKEKVIETMPVVEEIVPKITAESIPTETIKTQLLAQFKRRKVGDTKNLSSLISKDIWNWLDRQYHGSGTSKVELIEQALISFLDEKYMPDSLKGEEQ